MRFATMSRAAAALVALASMVGGCGSDDPLGGMGGQIFGDMASKTAGDMMTGNAQKNAQNAQKQQQQAAAQQQRAAQQAAAQQAAQQRAAIYQPPAMEMTGTLAEKPADGAIPATWSFTQDGTNITQAVDVSRVQKDARALAGKKVTITGRFDTLNTGGFVVEKVAAAAPAQ